MPKQLFLGSKTIEEWRAASQTTHQKRLVRLLDQADSYHTWLPPHEHPRETITYIGMAVANLALAFLLTEKTAYVDMARRWMDVAINYPHWGRAKLPDHDLDAGWLCFGFGLAYDWLGDMLPATEREALRAKLLLQGQRLFDFAVEQEGRWWSSAYWQNHNWICYAGLATVAYALEAEHPEARAWSDRACDNFRTVMSLLPEDGSDYEGPVYWCYGVLWLLIGCDLLHQQTGIDFEDNDFLRYTFYYRLYVSAPNLVDTANFGDCHDRRSAHSAAIYYRLAGLYRNRHAQWLAEHFTHIGEWEREGREGQLRPGLLPQAMLEFLWYDPSVEPESIADLPLVRAFPDLGLVSARSDWGPEATFLAFKSGKPSGHKAWTLGYAIDAQHGWHTLKASHAHPDENSFILVRGDDYLAIDEGYSQTKQSRHHNVLLIDGQGQYHEGSYDVFSKTDASWGGQLEHCFAGCHIVYSRGDAAMAYDPALTLQHVTRQMLLIGARQVVICDDVVAQTPREVTWQLQTDQVAQHVAEHRFVVAANDTQLSITALLPEQRKWENHVEEIVANPSSSTPEWIIHRQQHTLALTNAERATSTRFLVLLNIDTAGAQARQYHRLICSAGDMFQIDEPDYKVVVGFSGDRQGIQSDGFVSTDARWLVAELHDAPHPTVLAAGEVTQVWLAGRLYLSATEPIDFAMDNLSCAIHSSAARWMSFWTPVIPVTVLLDGKPTHFTFNQTLSMVRVFVPMGDVTIMLKGDAH